MAANVMLNVPRGRPVVFPYMWVAAGFAISILAAVFAWPLFDCSIAFESNRLVCGDGTEVTIVWSYFWGCVAFAACIVCVLYVLFASYKVLFTVPRKNDPSTLAFNKSKDQEIAQLVARRFDLAFAGGNPFGPAPAAPTAASAASGISSSNVATGSSYVDDDDVYGVSDDDDVVTTDAEAPLERVTFDLSQACAKPTENVLCKANLLPVGVPVVAASFVRHAEHESAPLLPQERPVQ